MALPIRDQLRAWTIAALLLGALMWLLSDVLLPFVSGMAAAYLLNPATERLVRLGLPRLVAVSVLILGLVGASIVALVLVIPTLVGQAQLLFQTAPEIFRQLQGVVSERFPEILDAESTLRRSLEGLGDTVRDRGLALADRIVSAASGLISLALFIVIAPVVTFYLLLDWPKVLAGFDDLLPRAHAATIRDLAGQIDRALAGFVRGQLSVCMILAVYYATALGLVGLQFGLIVGVVAGLISFIPYVGAIVGGALSIGLALFQFWGTPLPIVIVVGIFVAGQLLEGNVLVPKLVGRSVGLHPVWLLLAVTAFGTLFGFTGMLVAVPVAAAAGVLVRFGLARYRESPLYRDTRTSAPTEDK